MTEKHHKGKQRKDLSEKEPVNCATGNIQQPSMVTVERRQSFMITLQKSDQRMSQLMVVNIGIERSQTNQQ